MTTKYEFTGEIMTQYGITLKRIRRIRDRLVGGWIESEYNLSQEGEAFVFDEALVSGNAQVFGRAQVFGKAQVSGEAIATTNPYYLTLTRNSITVTDTHIQIGCELHTHEEWLANYITIGEANGYTTTDIKLYGKMIKLLIKRKRTELESNNG